jgi:hypothetical protein
VAPLNSVQNGFTISCSLSLCDVWVKQKELKMCLFRSSDSCASDQFYSRDMHILMHNADD